MKHSRPLACLALSFVGFALAACSSAPKQIIQGRQYPADGHRTGSVDIQVFRRDTQIEFTNTTAHAYGPSTLWLNARFSHPIDGLAIGQTVKLALKTFTDEFGEPFKGGGFFATQKPEKLALAELDTGTDLVGLVVVGAEEP